MKETDPLNNLGGCGLFEFMFESVIPDTPHPDCKLNDLPTQKEIHKGIEDSCNTLQGSKETRESRTSLNEAKKWNGIGFVDGVKWTIEKISK